MRRRQIAIGLLGLLLAAVPLAGVHLLVGWHTREQGTDITNELATQVIGRVDSAIDEGLVALTELSMLGVHQCGDSELDLMRRAVYANYALKEVAITDDNGNVVCNHIGDRSSMRATSKSIPSRNGKIRLTPVELGTSGRFGLMLTLALPNGGGLSAIVPGEVIATDVLPTNLRDTSVGVLTLSGGVRVATMPATTTVDPPAEPDASVFAARTYSARYPLYFALFVPYDTIWEETRPLRVWANIGAFLMSLIIAGSFLQLMRRGPSETNEIRVGIERGEFIPYYQPVVDIQTGRLMGCEVLIRWRKPDGTIADRRNAIVQIGWRIKGKDEIVANKAALVANPLGLEILSLDLKQDPTPVSMQDNT